MAHRIPPRCAVFVGMKHIQIMEPVVVKEDPPGAPACEAARVAALERVLSRVQTLYLALPPQKRHVAIELKEHVARTTKDGAVRSHRFIDVDVYHPE